MRTIIFCVLSCTLSTVVIAQKTDTLQSSNIDEIIVTGQYMPQSINKSVYKVEVIDAEKIKNMAANTVADVLNQNLNMMIVPSSGSGDSSARILGLGGDYVKVLIDNIPVVNDEGLGNIFDLTKLNVNNVERIEIVKGSMGVEYGNNAVTAVINVITKKGSAKKVSVSGTLQEETVNKEYDWYKKGQGRHIQNLNIGYNITKNWFVGADINHNDFQGFLGDYKGYRYFNYNDGKRGYQWQPKDQINGNGIIRYTKDKTTIFYKLNFLNENINYRDHLLTQKSYTGGNQTYFGNDIDYFTQRWLHQLNVVTLFGNIKYMGDFSYQTQTREQQKYKYDVPNRQELSRDPKEIFYDSEVLYSKGLFSNFTGGGKFNFMIGYEMDITNGLASREALSNNKDGDLRKKIINYANFISAEWQLSPSVTLRPGFRLALSDRFDTQYNYSLSSRFNLIKNTDLRLIAGSANRFPKFEELFTYMVDNNHDIRGNENLKPENGLSIGLFVDRKNDANTLALSFSTMYLQVNDRIELATVNIAPLQFKYINIDKYKSLLFTTDMKYNKDHFSLNAGVSVMGDRRKLVGPNNQVPPKKFYFYPEANLSSTYRFNFGTNLALFYKYSGSAQRIVMETPLQGDIYYRIGKIQDYHLLDFLVSQPFYNNHLEFSVGIKNIFDVSDLRDTTLAGTAHEGSTYKANYFYGRSYLARISFNF